MVKEKEEVELFLRQFFPKLKVMGIVFLHREKNLEALKRLGITPAIREEVIRTIEVDDYVETISDMASFGDMWVFGKDYDGNELLLSDILGTEEDMILKPMEDDVDLRVLRQAVKELPSREREIIVMRFGLEGHQELTQKEVAQKMGISQSYISRLEKRIMQRLKKELIRQTSCA